MSGLEDLRIEERLHCYITGAANSGDLRGNEGFDGSVGNGSQGDMDWNFRIDEVTSPNTDVTASGATLALGLMYIRSQYVLNCHCYFLSSLLIKSHHAFYFLPLIQECLHCR